MDDATRRPKTGTGLRDEETDPPTNDETDPASDVLTRFPFYEEGKVPQYHRYHAEVSYLDELPLIWGKRWGAQGIGRLREVAMVRPTHTEVRKLYEQDSAYFVFNGITPDLALMQAQHQSLAKLYERLGVTVHYVTWPDDPPRSAYGPMKRSISAAAGFVVNGGAIIPREATPYWRGRSRYVSQFLMGLGCPILYTVHGHGVCEIGAAVRMSDDFIVLMLSTDCNRDGADQVIPILHRAGYKEVLLLVNVDNVSARKLYSKIGYKDLFIDSSGTTVEITEYQIRNVPCRTVCMRSGLEQKSLWTWKQSFMSKMAMLSQGQEAIGG